MNFQSYSWQLLLNEALPMMLFVLLIAYISWAVAWLFAKHPSRKRESDKIAEPKEEPNGARQNV